MALVAWKEQSEGGTLVGRITRTQWSKPSCPSQGATAGCSELREISSTEGNPSLFLSPIGFISKRLFQSQIFMGAR